MLKKIFLTVLILSISAFIFLSSFLIAREYILKRFSFEDVINEEGPEEISNDFIVYDNEKDGIRLVISKLKPEIIYNPKQEIVVKDVAIDNGFKIVINGGYFNPENKYAGALIVDSRIISAVAPLDSQLSHVFTYESEANIFGFIKTTEFKSSNHYDLAFQTGPLFIENNTIQNVFIDNSINGKGEYQRSFLGITSDNDVFVGITLKKTSLKELGKYILNLEVFKDKEISVINLDGGSSVSLFLGVDSKLNYGQYKVLPILIGFK